MQQFRVWWNSFKTVAILLSFIINLVLIIVLLIVMMQLFQIKNGILEPLIDGLHRNFVGMDEATIITDITVQDQIPVQFDLPLDQDTNVVLTANVPIQASATFTLPGGGGMINGRVDIVLPEGLILPVHLNMIVPVDTQIPINLPVHVEIPLQDTQLHEPFVNLRNLLEPYVRAMDNLPDGWSDVPDFMVDAVQGDVPNLLTPKQENLYPWQTATPDMLSTPSSSDISSEVGTPPDTNGLNPQPTMTITPFIPASTGQ